MLGICLVEDDAYEIARERSVPQQAPLGQDFAWSAPLDDEYEPINETLDVVPIPPICAIPRRFFGLAAAISSMLRLESICHSIYDDLPSLHSQASLRYFITEIFGLLEAPEAVRDSAGLNAHKRLTLLKLRSRRGRQRDPAGRGEDAARDVGLLCDPASWRGPSLLFNWRRRRMLEDDLPGGPGG
jgi:hypothetical protein